MTLRQRLLAQRNQSVVAVPVQKVPSPAVPLAASGWEALGEGVWRRTFTVVPANAWPKLAQAPWFRGWDALVREHQASFDTETTGLSGGAGTVAFLSGTARWQTGTQGPEVQVSQYFLDDYPGEALLLDKVLDSLSRSGTLITYNGASFDMPLLRTRCIMNGITCPDFAHRDILPSARRLWRGLLGAVPQGALEQAVLDHQRTSDVPSAMVPLLYQRSLGSGLGPAHPELAGVFAHHGADLANLLVLAGLVQLLRQGAIPARPIPDGSAVPLPWTLCPALPVSLRGMALELARDDPAAAADFLESALAPTLAGEAPLSADGGLRPSLELYSRLLWRQGRRVEHRHVRKLIRNLIL